MAQINVRVDTNIDEIITFLASEKKLSKSIIARDLISQGLNAVLLPTLAKLYQEGKISLKKIVSLMGLPAVDVIEKLSQFVENSPMTDQLEEYSTQIADNIIDYLLQQKKM